MLRPPRRLAPDEPAELVAHLDELRARIVVCLVAVAAGFGVAYAFRGRLLEQLGSALPLAHRHPVTLGVAEPFMTSLKVSLFAGFALALPIVLWQIWSYLAPALEPHVQRTIAGLVAAATGLFAAGVLFGDRVALPAAVHFLTSYDETHYTIVVRAQDYYTFALMVLGAVGVVFELPIVVLGLVRLRVLSAAKLRRNRRVGYVIVAALAVALPGVDPVTTALEMVPLFVLFEAAIWAAVLLERRRPAGDYRPARAEI
jgi:sec-independent protein translocase protein TatC